MAKSLQHKLDRVRKPRVHITYDVEIGDAVVQKELPFVMGVMGDFSGNPTKKPDPLKERKFVNIDRDNFDDVMSRISPELNMRVKNTLAGDDSEMAVQLNFNSMKDFDPAAIVEQPFYTCPMLSDSYSRVAAELMPLRVPIPGSNLRRCIRLFSMSLIRHC